MAVPRWFSSVRHRHHFCHKTKMGSWLGMGWNRTSAFCFTDRGPCLQGKMASQRTGDWRRPWTASHGSSPQPAWPARLSEMPRRATRHPSRTRALLGCAWARKGWAQPTALPTAALGHHPRRQLAAAAHCLTEHRFPCPEHQPCGGHARTPGRGGARCTPHPSTAIENTQGTFVLQLLIGAAGRRTGFLSASCLPVARGRVPFPGRTRTLEAMLFLSRSRLGWEGTAALFAAWKSTGLK